MQKKLDWVVFWLVFLIFFFSFIFLCGEAGIITIGRMKRKRADLKQQVIALHKSNQKLREEIKGIRKNPYYTERILREQLNLVRPNEYIYLFGSGTNKTKN
ncbi:MAG: FtsB family cell division protein [bacterium]